MQTRRVSITNASESLVTRVVTLELVALFAIPPGALGAPITEERRVTEENCTLSVPNGAKLEWKRRNGKAGEFKVKRVEAGSPAADQGYRPEDEIVSIGAVAVSDQDLRALLDLSREGGNFTVRRKQEELKLPPLFRSSKVLESSDHALKPGDRAPNIPVFLQNGKPHDVLDLLKGRVLLLTFWATWCGPCLEEMPLLGPLQARYGAQGLTILAVNVDDDSVPARQYLEKSPPGVQVIWAGGIRGRQADSYGVQGIPLNVLVDRDRRIAQVRRGYSVGNQETILSRGIEMLLDPNDSPLLVVRR